MRKILAVAAIFSVVACGEMSPTEPEPAGPACTNPAPLKAPQSCADPSAAIDDFIIQLRDGIDYEREAKRLGTKYGFTPELFWLTPNFFGARLARRDFYAIQCEASVVALWCSRTNIPPPQQATSG